MDWVACPLGFPYGDCLGHLLENSSHIFRLLLQWAGEGDPSRLLPEDVSATGAERDSAFRAQGAHPSVTMCEVPRPRAPAAPSRVMGHTAIWVPSRACGLLKTELCCSEPPAHPWDHLWITVPWISGSPLGPSSENTSSHGNTSFSSVYQMSLYFPFVRMH